LIIALHGIIASFLPEIYFSKYLKKNENKFAFLRISPIIDVNGKNCESIIYFTIKWNAGCFWEGEVSMRDTNMDVYSRQTGKYNYSLKSRLKPRCGPCRHKTKTMASGPLLNRNTLQYFTHRIQNFIQLYDLSINRKAVYLFFMLVTFFIDTKLEAVPVFESEIEVELLDMLIQPAGRNSFMNDSIPFPCSWFWDLELSETQYSEWVPFQDLRYRFLEQRYNIVGGSYLPGSIGYPLKQNVKIYVIVLDNDEKEDKSIDIQEQIGKKIIPNDIISHTFFSSDVLPNTSIGINTVPEPSSITLFAFTAFWYLYLKKR
jgi:hypothetical protein